MTLLLNVVTVNIRIARDVDCVNINGVGWTVMAHHAPARPVRKHAARKRANRYHHGDLRRALLQVAVNTIRTDGVESLTLRGVGSRLGVSRTALYRHFTDKAALLAAVAAEGFRLLRAELTESWTTSGRGFSGLRAMGVAYVQFAVTHPSHYRVMFGADIVGVEHEELSQEGAGAFQVLVDAIAELQAQDLARRDDPRQMALFVWAATHGVAMLAIDRRLGHEASATDALTRYMTERLRAAIASGSRG
jgi:AcrR family transcriptional regulator